MEILGVAHLENHHRSMIAWLLDPRGSHHLGPALLAALLRRSGRPDLAGSPQLVAADVRQEYDLPGTADIQHRRADIVVWTAGTAVVVELKVHSHEHWLQTEHLRAHFDGVHQPHLVFLTLTGEDADDPAFVPVRLGELALDLSACLTGAAAPGTAVQQRGRATAFDYLHTLERKTGAMADTEPISRFWIRHSRNLDIKLAKQATTQLFDLLPEAVATALAELSESLEPGLTTSTVDYRAKEVYEEQAVLLLRKEWAGELPLAGVGFGMRVIKPTEDRMGSDYYLPFLGIWINDSSLHASWPRAQSSTSWSHWVDWSYLDLAFDDSDADLIALYAARVSDEVKQLWERNARPLGTVVAPTAEQPVG